MTLYERRMDGCLAVIYVALVGLLCWLLQPTIFPWGGL